MVVLTLCNIPIGNAGIPFSGFRGFDKLVHLGFFLVLTLLIFWGQIKRLKTYSYTAIHLASVVAITFLFGSSIELLQWKVFTYRSGDWYDLLADMVGVALAISAQVLLYKKQFFYTFTPNSNENR
jgi:VanZ family protein